MALIGTIRERGSWILIIMVALGLGGFLIMDMFSGQTSIFGSGQTTIGSINGKDIDINTFNQTEAILYQNATGDAFARKTALWNYFVEESIIEEESAELGLGVSKEELLDLQFGNNISPVIQQRFQDPATRQVDRNQLNQIRQQIESNTLNTRLRQYWAIQEDEIIKDRLQTKLTNMVSKAMYTPSWQSEALAVQGGSAVDFTYVQVPFDEVANADVSVTDADYEAYLADNKAKYTTTEETRKVEYVVFDVVPSKADSQAVFGQAKALAKDWSETTNDTLFVESNYGQLTSAYLKKDQLGPNVADTLMKMAVGQIYGPYLEGRAYNVIKVLDRKVIPDSVKASHILLKVDVQNPGAAQLTLAKADSLQAAIESGAIDFATAAQQNSEDASNASKGGDLGFFGEGRMVGPFNDMAFYQAKGSEINQVITQFGVHLIKVTDRKYESNEDRIRIAVLPSEIEPSEETQDKVESRANLIMQENRDLESLRAAIAKEAGLSMRTSAPLMINDFQVSELGTGQSSRDMIKWAFSASEGSVSPEIYYYTDQISNYVNKYVLVGMKQIRPAGAPKLEYVKEEIAPEVMKLKKAEAISSKLAGQSNLASIASSYGLPVDTARSATLSSGFIAGLGSEPEVIVGAYNTAENSISKPIQGNSGVFVVQPIMKQQGNATDMTKTMQQKQAMTNAAAQVRNNLLEAMKKNADIDDNRAKFF